MKDGQIEIEFIYTFTQGGKQPVWRGKMPLPTLRDAHSLADFARKQINEDRDLCKISACVYYQTEVEKEAVPDWFWNCNGKLFFEGGLLKGD